jgi:uncharacterized protein
MTTEEQAPERETVAMIEELATPECWRLLARSPLGRLCFVAGGDPAVLPVNHVVDDHSIVIRTGRTGILERLASGATVAFEVDETGAVSATGWSVVAKGYIIEITDETELAAVTKLALHPWVSGRRDHWLRIRPWQVTGRRINRRPAGSFGHRTFAPGPGNSCV